jgi:hypothetical protein
VKTLRTLLVLAIVGLAVFFVLQAVVTTSPELKAARARQAAAEARIVEAKADKAAAKAQAAARIAGETADEAVFALQVVLLGAGLAGFVFLVGGAVGAVILLNRRAAQIHPTKGGQFPLVMVGGRDWAGYYDPNRSPSSVTAFDRRTGAFAQPTPLSEAATVALAGQATAAAMVAAATRHPSTSRANMLTAVDAVMTPATLSKPLPPVEVIEDADHIDRLLQLTAPDDWDGDQ